MAYSVSAVQQPGWENDGPIIQPSAIRQSGEKNNSALPQDSSCETPLVPMPVPQRPLGCPPGLEYLTVMDVLLIHKKENLAAAVFGCATEKKYKIKNGLGQQFLYAEEENDCCNLQCCGSSRSFLIRVSDNLGQQIMTLTRPLNCDACCFPGCLQELEVQSPPGIPIGYVIQDWHPYLPKFTVQNERKEPVLKIVGPFWYLKCCTDVNFKVATLNETEVVGRITSRWSDDALLITFPLDLDVKIKAVMLGASILIDFMNFVPFKYD
ncbi:phospholipid scramblase 2-like [Megalops cyprinoides]|uniref:phospholipid scramblase 2-like n=1 Tax=Megalops cyprinoides TaxID=118141 RepID=UPI001864FC05|nr:phospholipid scramblase 2-like [Megalops cyprinoides]